MIFQIDNSLLDTLAQEPHPSYLIVFTEELFRARRLGNHIIYAQPEILEAFEAIPGLSLRTTQVIKRVKSRQRSKKSLFDSMKTFVRIIANENIIRKIKDENKTIIEVSANILCDGDFLGKTNLLTENATDAELYNEIAETYYKYTNSNQHINRNFNICPGGGSQTPRYYRDLKKRNELTLCIVDGDIEHPKAELGNNTARPIADDDANDPKPYSESLILRCYSIENLIPPEIIQKSAGLSGIDAPWIREIKSHYQKEFWPYLPLKRKKKCSDFHETDEKSLYWQKHKESFTPESIKCSRWGTENCSGSCVVFSKISDNTLDNVIDCIKNEKSNNSNSSLYNTVKSLPEPIETLWKEIAEKVTAWGCSGDKINAT